MNEFRERIDKICEQQNALYEGLITSHPIETIFINLKDQYNISYNEENKNSNTFFLTYIFSHIFSVAESELLKILTLTNNLGWYPANIAYGNKLLNIVKWDKRQENFKNLILHDYTNLKFLFEPKYDTPAIKHERYLYH